MSTFYTHKSKNIVKTWSLMIIIMSVLIGLGWFISYYIQEPNLFYMIIVISIGINIWAYWFSHLTAIRMSRAKEVLPKDNIELHRLVENLSITAGLPKPKIFLIDDPSPNAFATGRDKNHAVIAVSTGLLEMLDKRELEGVIAHELAHIGNNDMLLATVVVVFVAVITILSDILLRISFTKSSSNSENNGGIVLLVVSILAWLILPLAATVLRLSISRKREFLADATAVQLTRFPEGLASALKKISSTPLKMRHANKATSHLFISNPFAKKNKGFIARLFSTHPQAKDRIEALNNMNL